MSEFKGTPGPWKRDAFGNVKDSFDRSVGFRSVMTVCAGSQERIDEAEANTDLIAAAPRLLNALQKLVSQTRDGMGYEYDDGEWPALDEARAAIAKALG